MKDPKAKLIASIKSVLSHPLNAALLKSLLADVRKLLETTGNSDKYATLKFHCDWVLHTKMSKRFASELLRKIDEAFDNTVSKGAYMSPEIPNELMYRGFLGFVQELREFLKRFKIIILQLENDVSWLPLQRLYYSIVEDAHLEYTVTKEQPPLKRINHARARMFRLADATDYPDVRAWYLDQPEAILPYGLEWTFSKDEQDVFKIPVTGLLPSYVERDVKEESAPNPAHTLLRCWPPNPGPQPH